MVPEKYLYALTESWPTLQIHVIQGNSPEHLEDEANKWFSEMRKRNEKKAQIQPERPGGIFIIAICPSVGDGVLTLTVAYTYSEWASNYD